LDTRYLGKGLLWVNGQLLGRFWDIGPQFALYVPGVWLRRGRNEVIAFDLLERDERRSSGRTQPLYAPIAS
jgi:beta-galactosidase